MAYDFDAAEAAGYSKQDILKELEKSGKVNYDFAGARKAGYKQDDIYEALRTKMQAKQELPEIPDELPEVVPGPPEEYEVSEDGTYNIPGIAVTPAYSPEGTEVTDEAAKEVGLIPLPPRAKTENTFGEEIIGGLETAATLVTGATTGAIGAIVGQGAAATEQTKRRLMGDKLMTDAEYEAYASEPAQALTYAPRTKAGQEDVAAIGKELAVFEYMSPLLVETAGLSGLAKTKVDGMLAKRSKVLGELAADPLALSAEAKYLIAKHPDLDDKTVIEKLGGVKLADQAHALTRYLQEPGYAEKAIAEGGSKAAGHLRAKLDMERLRFLETVGNADMDQAKFQYGDMVRKIGEGYTGVHDASGLATNVNALFEVHGIAQGRVGTTVRGLKQAIGQDGRLSLQDALDLLPDINHMLNKATRGVEKTRIKEIKTEVQQFINSVATPEQQKLMDGAISNYSKTAQNNDILEIVSKHTNPQGFAVNWTKVHRDMEDAGLRSPEAVRSLRIAEAYATKFGNAKELGELALPVGTSPSAGGVMGVMGLIANGVRNIAAKAELGVGIQTGRGTDLRIQESILKTIMKDLQSSKSELDFVDRLMKDTKIPEETKIDLKGIFEPKQIPYKPGARQTGDVNLEPIVTPVGGRDMAPPAQVVDDVIPPLSENKALQQAIDEIPTKPSSAAERETWHNPQSEESGVRVANEIYRQGPHLAERRIEELQSYSNRTPAETAELRTLQDHMIEAGTGYKDDVAKTTDLVEGSGSSIPESIVNRIRTLGSSDSVNNTLRTLRSMSGREKQIAEIEEAGRLRSIFLNYITPASSARQSIKDTKKAIGDLENLATADPHRYTEALENARARLNNGNGGTREIITPTRDELDRLDALMIQNNRVGKTPEERTAIIRGWRESANAVDPGDIEQFRLFNDLPDRKATAELRNAIAKLEQGESVTINGKTFDKYHLYLNDDGEASVSQPLLNALNRSTTPSANVDSLRTAIKSGAKVYPDLSEEELKALSATFPRALRIEFMEAERDLQKALMNNIEDLQPFHERVEGALDRGVRAEQAATTPAVPTQTPIQRAEETFNTLRRDIQRLERVRAADRTPQQSAQLSEMRRERLLASREVERLRAGGEGADRLFNSFRGSDHTIEVTDRGNGSFHLKFNGTIVPMTINTRNNTVSLNTQGFTQGSRQGAQFYKEFYKALDAAGLKHDVSGLTSVNQMRLPINIYKHKLDSGNLPITGGQQTLQRLMRNAIGKINEIAGREIKHLNDGQLEELAKRTGPMRDVHAGINSLKLYRKAARLLSDGRALSIGALAPFINQAYSEIEED